MYGIGDRRLPEELSAIRYEVLVGRDRWIVAGTLSGLFFIALLITGTFVPTDFRTFVATKEPIQLLFQGLVLILITGVTLVLSINQLVLSQELVAASDQRERLEVALDFRGDVADLIAAEVTPARPAELFASVLHATRRHANGMRGNLPDDASDEFREAVNQFSDRIETQVEDIVGPLEEATFGSLTVMREALRFNNSKELYEISVIRGRYGHEFSDEFAEQHRCVLDSLKHFSLAREYFKSLYIQRELIELSERMIYVSVPALFVAVLFVLFVDETVAPGATVGIDHLLLLVSAAVTFAVTPFILLVAYVLRVGVITRITLAVGPFQID